MKKITVKLLRKASREQIPVSQLRGRIMSPKKRKLLEKVLEKESREEVKGK
jgi:hypothetical protein